MQQPQKFRKKPVEIEAMQVTGENVKEVARWCGGEIGMVGPTGTLYGPALFISTLEGTMAADDRDWIIRGVQGEFYPCKPDIFAATYEEV